MNYIIGAGINGFIAKKFFPDYKIISDKKGFLPELFYIWNDKYTRRFCKENNIKYEIADVKIGKYGNDIKLYNKITHKPEQNVPCENKESFEALKINIEFEEPDIKDTVVEITKNKIVCKNHVFDYDKLIYTGHITKDIFKKITKKYCSINYFPLSYVKIKDQTQIIISDFVYLLDPKYLSKKIYRVSKQDYGLCFEVAGNISDIRKKFFDERFKNIEYFEIKKGFVSGFNFLNQIPEYKNIAFIGRYAEANHELKANDIIKNFYEGVYNV